MKEFILAALPFVIMGICLAIIFANYHKDQQNYLSEGIGIGLCLGVCFGCIFDIHLSLSMSLGVLIGETIGILIKK